MQKDELMKWPFKREDMADNLIEWAGKIKALGEVWGALSWHVDRYDGDTDALGRCGETLGTIIGDYAGMIEDTVTEDMSFDKNGVNPLAGCQEAYDFIGKTRRVEDLIAVDSRLQELSSFISNAAVPAIGLKNDFEALKKEILAKQESAAAGDLDKNVVSRLARLRHFYNCLRSGGLPEDADILKVHLHLNELTHFISNAANPAIRLKEDFLTLLNDIAAREKTPAAESAAAGA